MTGSWNGLNYIGDDANEVATGTTAAESFYMGQGDDVANGGGGGDYLDGGLGSDTLHGGDGDDVVFDINSFDSGFSGLIGKDQVFGDAGDDELHIASPDTHDIADGGEGQDTIYLDFSGQFSGETTSPIVFTLRETTNAFVGGVRTVAVLNCETANVVGGTGDDTLTGGSGDDTLSGVAGHDVLRGMGGDDVIDPGRDDFQVDGGSGSDIFALDLSYDFADLTIVQSAAMSLTGSAMTGTAAHFERLDIRTGGGGDTLTGGKLADSLDSGSGSDLVTGGAGNNSITIGSGSETVDGGLGNDTVRASNSFAGGDTGDIVDGGAGDDVILLAGCADGHGHVADGGIGNDMISVAYQTSFSSHNVLKGGDGNDALGGGLGQDDIDGGDGNDSISGNVCIHSALGGRGDDSVILSAYGGTTLAGQVLDGGQGFDYLALSRLLVDGTLDLSRASREVVTAEGSHIRNFEHFGLFYNATNFARIITGDGNDTVDGNPSAGVVIFGRGGDDRLSGRGSGGARLYGGDGDDVLNGYANGCESFGGAGSDRFVSFSGAQTVTGDGGADTFVWQSASYSTVAKAGRDIVKDFSHADGDHIDLSAIDADSTVAGNDAFHWGGGRFDGEAGELIVSGTGGKYVVQGDLNGDGVSDFAITVFSGAALGAGDFVL